MKIKLIKFKSVKSTNDIAIKLIKKKKLQPTLISSEKQNKRKRNNGKKMDISKRKFIYINFL